MALTKDDDEEKEDNPKMINTLLRFSGYKIKFFHYSRECRERHAQNKNLENSNLCLSGLVTAIVILILFGSAISWYAWNPFANQEYLERTLTDRPALNASEDLAKEISSPESLKEIPDYRTVDTSVKPDPQNILMVISHWGEIEDDVGFPSDSEDGRNEGNTPTENLDDVQSMAINSHNPVDDGKRNLDSGTASTSWNVNDSPYSYKDSKTLSRHIRNAEKSTSIFKDQAWITSKLQKRVKREPLKLSVTTTFVADFYGHHFDFGTHFMDHECIPVEQWNQTTACRDGKIEFRENGTALPFYEYRHSDDGAHYATIQKSSTDPGLFLVQKAGNYSLHLNITILGDDDNDNHYLAIFKNNHQTKLKCQMTDKGHGHSICEITESLALKKNDDLQVKTLAPNLTVRLEPFKSFLRFTLKYPHASRCPE